MANEEPLLFSNRAQIKQLCNNYHSDSFVFEACTWLLQTFRTVDHIQYERFRQFLSFSALAKGQKRSRRYTVTSWNGKHSRWRLKNEQSTVLCKIKSPHEDESETEPFHWNYYHWSLTRSPSLSWTKLARYEIILNTTIGYTWIRQIASC